MVMNGKDASLAAPEGGIELEGIYRSFLQFPGIYRISSVYLIVGPEDKNGDRMIRTNHKDRGRNGC
jgi:hypothetical protein